MPEDTGKARPEEAIWAETAEDGRNHLGQDAPAPDEPFALDVLTARGVCELPDPPKSDELLGPLVVRGSRLVLGGNTGEGKTTMALAIVRAVVARRELPRVDRRPAAGRS